MANTDVIYLCTSSKERFQGGGALHHHVTYSTLKMGPKSGSFP